MFPQAYNAVIFDAVSFVDQSSIYMKSVHIPFMWSLENIQTNLQTADVTWGYVNPHQTAAVLGSHRNNSRGSSSRGKND